MGRADVMQWGRLAACTLALLAGLTGLAPAPALAVPMPARVGEASLLIDSAEIYPAILRTVDQARRSIAIDYYVLGGPRAVALADHLVAKQAEGVAVRVLLDPDMGTLPALQQLTRPVLAKLQEAGVPVRFYPREALARRHRYRLVEDHNKAVVADGVAAVVSSMNFGSTLLENHEVGLHVEGGVAHAIDQDILSAFALAEPLGPEHDMPWPAAAMPTGQGSATIAYVPTGLFGEDARATVIGAIAGARHSIAVMMSQLEDQAVVTALVEAARRGVDVRVLLDPNQIDHLSPLGWAPAAVFNLAAAVRLADAGVHTRWFAPPAGQHTLHAKSALIDGQHLLVGSTNWNQFSFDLNNETLLTVDGGAAPARFARTFEHDWHQRGQPFQREAWGSNVGPRLWAYQGLAWMLN